MSHDEVRWCDDDNEHESTSCKDDNDSYTFRSVYHNIKHDKDYDDDDDDQISLIKIHKHRNNRDSRRNNAATKINPVNTRLIILVLLHILSNFLVSNVNCDDLMETVGARGHYTHTWAVHIPGGENVAKQVADDHGMIFRGKVSNFKNFEIYCGKCNDVQHHARTI